MIEKNNELTETDKILPGGIGTVHMGNTERDITAIRSNGNGSVTLTIGAPKKREIITEDVEAEIVSNQKLLK